MARTVVPVNTRKRWLLWIGACSSIALLFWDTVLVKPLRIFAVFFHELCHALTAFITGGGVTYIEVTSYEAGRTAVYGGLAILVYSAGYVGTAVIGAALLISGLSFPAKRLLYLALSLFTLIGTLLFIRNGFGWAYGIVTGGFLLCLFFYEFPFANRITDVLAVVCILYSFYDFGDFFFMDNRNDALILHEITGASYLGIVLTWLILNIVIVGSAVVLRVRAISTIEGDKRLRREDFRLRITGKDRPRSEENPVVKKGRWTILVYFGIFASALIAVVWASRFVLFQPWTARDWVAGAAAEKAIYVAGGRNRHGQVFDEIFKIQPDSKKIRTVAELPSPRYGVGVVSVDESVYVIGGFDGRECFADVIVFNVNNGSLKTVADLPGERAFGGVARVDGAIYYIGGWDGNEALNEILEYSIDESSFRLIGRLPSPRELITAVAINGYLYVLGGSDDRGQYLDEILEIDVSSGEIRRTGFMPYEIKRCDAVEWEGNILLTGGWEGRKSERVIAVSLEDLTTASLPDLPRGFADHALVVYRDGCYLIGGFHPRFKRQIGALKIDPAAGTSEEIKFRSFLVW